MAIFETSIEFIEEMMKGDPKCSFPIGAEVEKTVGESKDVHPTGTKGKVFGSSFLEEKNVELYLVVFEGDELYTGIMGPKLKLIK